MKKRLLHIILLCVALGFSLDAVAQRMPERGLVRQGNRHFAKERYERSADSYTEALKHDSTSFEARYDLAGAMFRTERYAEAEEALKMVVVDSLQSAEDRAEAYFNLGNAQFAQQKLQEALQSFRSSLILNPDDMEAKYNYAYTKKLLEQNQNQNQDQNQDQNQNNDQNQDQNQNGGGGQNDQNQNDQNNDQNDKNNNDNNNQGDQNQDPNQNPNQDPNKGNGNDDKDGDGKPDNQPQQPPRSGMNQEQQQQLLNAIQAQEDKTQEKLDEKAKGVVIRGKKNW